MSKVKYLEMEDIAYKEWSDHLDFVASTRASPWLPAYGYHPPSPIQEIFQTQPDPFLSDNSSVGQQQYLVLETIVEETSDDLCSESDKSGPTGWNSDSDADSVIHLPKTSEGGLDWRERDCSDEVPKKRRCRIVDKSCLSDDDEPPENLESTSLSSRSSSLLAFESLEKHCEDFTTGISNDPLGSGINSEATRWNYTKSPESLGDLREDLVSSDDEYCLSSSVDTLHRSASSHGSVRSSLMNDNRLRPYRSFDSLNLFENTSPLTYTVAELSQSQSALDYEKAKEQEQEFVIRDKKLTATTADLSTMSDSYDTGLFSHKIMKYYHRRKQDIASYHYKEPHQFRNSGMIHLEGTNNKNHFSTSERKSYSVEGLKSPLAFIPEDAMDVSRENYGSSEPCLSLPSKPHPSVENLSEDSGFDDHVSAKVKLNLGNSQNSVTNVLGDEDSSPCESSSSAYSSSSSNHLYSNGNVEEIMDSSKSQEHSKFVKKNIGLKIKEEQESEARGSLVEENDVEVNFNPGQAQTLMFNCNGEERLFKQGEDEKLIATPSVTFASLDGKDPHGSGFYDFDVRPRPEFVTFCKGPNSANLRKKTSDEDLKSKCFFNEKVNVSSKPNALFYEAVDKMSTKIEKSNGDISRQMASRLPVLSTPNLLAGDEDFFRNVPSAASSLTHVPLKCYDEDEIDDAAIKSRFFDLKKTQLGSEFGGSQNVSGIKGVHFCPVVSELSWQDNYSEDSSSSTSSGTSTDELSNRSLEELCEMQNEEEEYHEVEEKAIPKFQFSVLEEIPKKEVACEGNFLDETENEVNPSEDGGNGLCKSSSEPKEMSSGTVEESTEDSKTTNVNNFLGRNKPYVEKKPVTPTVCATPTSSGHVFISDPAQPNAERRTRLSVSESSLPTQDHANDDPRGNDCYSSSSCVVVPENEMTTKKSKSRFGGFLERFSFRRLSNRKTSNGNSKKQNGKKEERKEKNAGVGGTARNGNHQEDVMIIPLHGPENEAEVKEIFRSVVSPHVVSSKPPLPPNFQRMCGGSRKRSPPSVLTGTVSVGLQDDETNGKKIMPKVRDDIPTGNDSANSPLTVSSDYAEPIPKNNEKPIGLLETDLDTHITVESAGRRPLVQCNVGSYKKARSLMNLGLGDMSVHQEQEQNSPSGYLEPSAHRSHGSVAVDDRAKSMEFLLDKENQAAVLPPENELQKGGTGERVMSEHQLRVQRSLQKLNIPDWYKSSAVSQTPQGFLLKRETRREHQGWPGLGSKTTSLSSLGSSQSASARSPTSHVLSPSPTPHLFTRWSTSRLNSNMNSSSTSPSGSARSSFNYRQPYLGWRSQEKLTRPRTPAERLAAGLLPLQKQQTSAQYNSQSSVNPNLSDVRTSIKEVTSAIVHYVSGVQENGSKETVRSQHSGASPSPSPKWQSSPRGSSGRLCWLESSFVGSRPLDQPETPLTLTETSSLKSEARANELYLDLKPHPQINHVSSNRMNESTPRKSAMNEEEQFEKAFEVRTRPSPASTTLDDILESLLGLPPTSRSPSPGPLSAAGSSPGQSRSLLPLPDRQHQRHSCGDIRANVSGSASDPGNASFAKEVMTNRRKSDGTGEPRLKRQGSAEQKTKRSGENNQIGREEGNKKELHPNVTETLVKCRYSKCGNTATVLEAKRTYKTCHNCSHVYCSRECRRAHWERHRRTCLHSRVGALCRQVLAAAKDDPKALHHLSLLARRGYLTHGRGAVKVFFSSPELAEKFVARGFDELGEPAYVKWSDLLPAEMGADLFAELMKICKSYNPDTRLVLYVAVCVVSEVPTTGAVKWERQLVSRCCKLQLDKSLAPPKVDKRVPPPLPPRRSSSESANITRDMENPETLILTSLPGIAGKIPEQKIREISFTNIQRELKARGVSLRRQFPEVYKKLVSYVEGASDHFTPATIYPRDVISGKTFMCIIMPDSEPEKLELVPKDSTRVQTIDVSVERKPS